MLRCYRYARTCARVSFLSLSFCFFLIKETKKKIPTTIILSARNSRRTKTILSIDGHFNDDADGQSRRRVTLVISTEKQLVKSKGLRVTRRVRIATRQNNYVCIYAIGEEGNDT